MENWGLQGLLISTFKRKVISNGLTEVNINILDSRPWAVTVLKYIKEN